jgi:hypothetical protein
MIFINFSQFWVVVRISLGGLDSLPKLLIQAHDILAIFQLLCTCTSDSGGILNLGAVYMSRSFKVSGSSRITDMAFNLRGSKGLEMKRQGT